MAGSIIARRSLRSLNPRTLFLAHRRYSSGWDDFAKSFDLPTGNKSSRGSTKSSRVTTGNKRDGKSFGAPTGNKRGRNFSKSFGLPTGNKRGPAPIEAGNIFITEHESNYWKLDLDNPTGFVSYYDSPGVDPIFAHRSWLRDSCTCHKCVDPSSGQKRYASSDVPTDLPISSLTTGIDGSLQVHWKDDFLTHDIHVSEYPLSLWHKTPLPLPELIPRPIQWNRESMKELSPYFSYQDFMSGGAKYRQALTALAEYGLIFLRDVPSSEETVQEMAGKIGFLLTTFYGKTWDVRSKPNAENVAYTNSYLGLHQDLLYMREAPRIQLLHCLKNTCSGGESLFSDGYRTVMQLRSQFPEMAKILAERKVHYHYNKGGNMYKRPRAVISKEKMYWSPPFQSPVQPDNMTEEAMVRYGRWLKAAKKLQKLLEDEVNMFEYKMQPGECVIFDNLRVLHGRRAFDTSSGERWLKGAYVDDDSHRSLLLSLNLVGQSKE